jgi:hypothetical protein
MEKRQKLLAFAYSTFIVFSLLALFAITGKGLGEADPNSAMYADFVGYYRSAKMVLSPDRHKIYDRELQLKYFNALGAAQESTQFIYSQNPPFFLVLLAPFALLPLNLSFKLWIALSIISSAGTLYLLMKNRHGSKLPTALIFTAAALVSASGWICILVGQMSWFMACLVALFFYALLSRKDALCGLALALSTGKFQYLIPLAVPLIAQKRWRAIAYASLFELSLLLLAGLVIGAENVINYPSLLAKAETTRDYIGVFPEYMISLRGVFSLFLDRHQALLASSASMLLAAIPLSILWWDQNRTKNEVLASWAVAITVCSALLFSAHTHIYDDVLLLVAAACTVPRLWSAAENEAVSNQVIRLPAILWQTILISFPISSWIVYVACSNFHQILRTPFAAINMLLLLCSACIYLRIRKSN